MIGIKLCITIFAKKIVMQTFINYSSTINDLSLRVDELVAKGLQKVDKQVMLKKILSFIDLTTLSGDDTIKKVSDLCLKSTSYKDDKVGLSNVAAVCVYPVFANLVSKLLDGVDVNVACVAGAFPSGQSPLAIRVMEVEDAVANGADEIDMVISRGKLIEGNIDYIFEEVKAIKAACGDAHLKVILETGELKTVELIRQASEISILAGADFIKTSTGKINPAATPEAFLIMLDTIKEYYEKTGIMIGIKPAGGISTPDEAIVYYLLVLGVLGDNWLTNKYFRMGASRLADNVYNDIEK
jgi:deoxyribose-phosphate aldolase